MPINIKQLQKDAKEFDAQGDEKKFAEKDQRKLEFFKVLLKSDYAREKLLLNNFNLQWIDNSKDLDIFEKSLEKACYHVKRVGFKKEERDSFLKEFDITVMDIGSYDLEERNKNIYQTPASKNRYHTDLWQAFWSNVDEQNETAKVREFLIGEVRLNPEVKIHYRKADENLKSYFKKRDFPPSFKHRRLQDQFTVHFTLALNAGKKYEDLAFSKPEELLDKINDFNKKLNKEMDFKTAWKYGIDRGNKELATLCLFKFDPNNNFYEVNNKDIVRPEFAKIKCYTLKDYGCMEEYISKKGESKNRYAIKNLSYFMDEKYLNNKDLFKEEVTPCLDLTTAKLIKGKIITNGDVMTYLKLKKAVAKRKLYEIDHKEIEGNAMLEWSEWEDGESNDEEKKRPEGVLNIRTSKGEKTIYWYCEGYEGIFINHKKNIKYNKQSIKDALNHYLIELRDNNESHTPTILQVNHLRDAIAANMVGVICHLQKTYKGFVILEDLAEGTVEKHFFNSNANISRRLENALYNKFQSLGLVPPHVKDIIRLREDIRKKQKRSQSDKKENKIKKLEENIEKMKENISRLNEEKKEKIAHLRREIEEKGK